jgi:hypothetical protein
MSAVLLTHARTLAASRAHATLASAAIAIAAAAAACAATTSASASRAALAHRAENFEPGDNRRDQDDQGKRALL